MCTCPVGQGNRNLVATGCLFIANTETEHRSSRIDASDRIGKKMTKIIVQRVHKYGALFIGMLCCRYSTGSLIVAGSRVVYLSRHVLNASDTKDQGPRTNAMLLSMSCWLLLLFVVCISYLVKWSMVVVRFLILLLLSQGYPYAHCNTTLFVHHQRVRHSKRWEQNKQTKELNRIDAPTNHVSKSRIFGFWLLSLLSTLPTSLFLSILSRFKMPFALLCPSLLPS